MQALRIAAEGETLYDYAKKGEVEALKLKLQQAKEGFTIYLYLKARSTDNAMFNVKPTEKEIFLYRLAEKEIAKAAQELLK